MNDEISQLLRNHAERLERLEQESTTTYNNCTFNIDTINYNSSQPAKRPQRECRLKLPDELATEKGLKLLNRLQNKGLLDEYYRPLTSNTESAYVANWLAKRLELERSWSIFSKMWGVQKETLRAYFNRALDNKKTSKTIEILKDIEQEEQNEQEEQI